MRRVSDHGIGRTRSPPIIPSLARRTASPRGLARAGVGGLTPARPEDRPNDRSATTAEAVSMSATASIPPAVTDDEPNVPEPRDDIQLTSHETTRSLRDRHGHRPAGVRSGRRVLAGCGHNVLRLERPRSSSRSCTSLTALGITVGFHRHLTHRAFATSRPMRGLLAIFGSCAIEGPVISWVADHRKHHAFSDQEGDPHSPHHGQASGFRGALRGLFHAHVGWLFVHDQRGSRDRYAPDLVADPVIAFVDRWFVAWVTRRAAHPVRPRLADRRHLAERADRAVVGRRWCGCSSCTTSRTRSTRCATYFGRRRFVTDDESRNLAWLSVLSLGESWHHNHHAFPTSAHHGCAGGRSTSRRWSSAACAVSGWCGTWSRSAPSASASAPPELRRRRKPVTAHHGPDRVDVGRSAR